MRFLESGFLGVCDLRVYSSELSNGFGFVIRDQIDFLELVF
jgi:hypothetical protein